MQLDSGHFQEQTQEYTRWKELRDRLAADLRLSFNNLKLQTSNLANHHLDVIKQLKELQFRILDQELNRWKRDQQLSGNFALDFEFYLIFTLQKNIFNAALNYIFF